MVNRRQRRNWEISHQEFTMQENQNAGQNGYSNYQSIGNQSSIFVVFILVFVLLFQLLKSEERYRQLLESLRSHLDG